jgi:hypothetical protein
MRIDDLVDIGDALVLRDRHRVDRVSARATAERPHVGLQIAREACKGPPA